MESDDRKLHQVRITKNFSAQQDPKGILTKLSQTDYFVDTQSNLVVKVEDLTYPIQTLTEDYPREVELEDYKAFSGVAVPTVVREKINGTTVWELRVSAISFNTDPPDADFPLR